MVRKQLYVVAYDVSDDKRRTKIVKILEYYGKRINLSVFECMVTKAQYAEMKKQIAKVCNLKKDHILAYPICIKCFSKIDNIAGRLSSANDVVTLV